MKFSIVGKQASKQKGSQSAASQLGVESSSSSISGWTGNIMSALNSEISVNLWSLQFNYPLHVY